MLIQHIELRLVLMSLCHSTHYFPSIVFPLDDHKHEVGEGRNLFAEMTALRFRLGSNGSRPCREV